MNRKLSLRTHAKTELIHVKTRHRPIGLDLLALLASLLACGTRSDDDTGLAEVAVTLSEWDFNSSQKTFTAGTPYRFVLRNVGTVAHEWAVVPRGATDESQVLVEVEEDDLPPGARVTELFTFPKPGEYDFACFISGHYEAGMKLPVTVTRP